MNAIIRSTGMKGYRELMNELGIDPLPLLDKHKLPADLGEAYEVMVPIKSVMRLMENSALVSQRPDIGLLLAERQNIDMLGPLAMALQHSSNVREAMMTASRYLYVHSPAVQLSVLDPSELVPGAVEIRIDLVASDMSVCRQTVDQCLGRMHHMVRSFAGKNYQLLAASIPYHDQGHIETYQRFFEKARIYSDQEHAGLHVAPKTLASPLGNVNDSLKSIAVDYLQRHYGDPELSMSERVRRALFCTLSATGGSKAVIAELLFMHPRTLQRKLSNEKSTFEGIRDEVRKEMAQRYLLQSSISLIQLTSLLGFSSQSVLTTASMRWFGLPPSKLRRLNT